MKKEPSVTSKLLEAYKKAQGEPVRDQLCLDIKRSIGSDYPPFYALLYHLARDMDMKLLVELGVQTGRGTAHMARGAPKARVVGVDPEPWDFPIIMKGCPNIELRKRRSDDPAAYSDLEDIDLLFVDSHHDGAYTYKETLLWAPRMAQNGIILYDDIALNDSMRQFWSRLHLQKVDLPLMHFSGFGAAVLGDGGARMKVAVVIPCWNKFDVTAACIDSMQANSFGFDLQLICIDNGSTDQTMSILKSKPKTTIIHNDQNMGVSVAWNQGVAKALEMNPDVIIVSNNDVVVGPGWLEAVESGVARAPRHYFFPNGRFNGRSDFAQRREAVAAAGAGQVASGRCGWMFILPVEAAKKAFPVPETLFLWHGDDYVHETLREEGWTAGVLMDCCVLHHGSVSVYSFPAYPDRIAQDKQAWTKICREHGWYPHGPKRKR